MAPKDKDQERADVQFYPASKMLQVKAPLIDKNLDQVLKKAASGLQSMAGDYVSWTEADLERLTAAHIALNATPDSEDAICRVHFIAHDMKGQGGSFGYPLMTLVLNSLCKYLSGRKSVDAEGLEVIDIHINSAKLVITNRLEGKGGKIGEEIINGLRAVRKKST